jgi:hypothetical protein
MASGNPSPPTLSAFYGKRLFPNTAKSIAQGTYSEVGGTTPTILQSEDNAGNTGTPKFQASTYVKKTSAAANDYYINALTDWTPPTNTFVVGLRTGMYRWSDQANSSCRVYAGWSKTLGGTTAGMVATSTGVTYSFYDINNIYGGGFVSYVMCGEFGSAWQYVDDAGAPWTQAEINSLDVRINDTVTNAAWASQVSAVWVDVMLASIPQAPVISSPAGTITDTLTPAAAWVHTDLVSATVTNRQSAGTTKTLTFASHPFLVDNQITVATGVAGYDGTFTVTAITATTVQYVNTASTVTEGPLAQAGTVTTGDGSPQTTYTVKVFSAAQYGIGGFNPDTSPSTFTTTGTGTTATTTIAGLTNATTYRAYVKTAKTSGSQTVYGAWAFSAFTTSVVLPATPTITATLDNPNQRVTLVYAAFANLLSAQDASMETATSTGSYVATTNCAIAQSTTFADVGTGSLRLTSVAAGNMVANTAIGVAGYPVLTGVTYSATLRTRAAVSARTITVGISWYDATGVFLSTTTGTGAANTAVGFTTVTVTGAAPASAAYAAVVVTVTATAAAAEVHYVDTVALHPGSTPAWMPGGATLVHVVNRTQGGVTTAVRGLVVDAAQRCTFADYEALRGVSVTYTATVTATYTTGTVAVSATGSSAAVTPTNDGTHWLKAPLASGLNIGAGNVHIQKGSPTFTREEDIGVFRPLGRSKAVVVAGDLEGEDGTFTLHTIGATEWANMNALIQHQSPLLWQDLDGSQKYVRVISRQYVKRSNGARREVSLTYVETDTP